MNVYLISHALLLTLTSALAPLTNGILGALCPRSASKTAGTSRSAMQSITASMYESSSKVNSPPNIRGLPNMKPEASSSHPLARMASNILLTRAASME